MNSRFILCAGALLALAACGGGNDNPNSVALSGTTTAGSSAMLIEGDPAGTFGESFIGSDGNGVMLIENDDLRPAAAYYEVKGNAVRRVPAAGSALEVRAVPGSAVPVKVKAITLADLAGSHMAINRDNTVAGFTVSADGAVSAGSAKCGLTGSIQRTSSIVGALPLTVTLNGCGTADGTYQGYAIKAGEYAPAAFRIVGENGVSFIDMLAFR
ncbi:hypothetical protein [Noviherbaspirillum saxi]|uniref:Lipoprotein n=1 Tax=Noviherbaspirillum saxi TaxID=2320863 RepID=A0A3A3FZQ9_9BURK|nr:hypothetical protein [Noviherbaspirillum saxi]RJF92559.1 hypothetical protein D3871_28605 [Noviherbaspirillum saxi]